MAEKLVLSTKAITLYVLAVLALGLGILFSTPVTEDIGGINVDKVVTGVILLFLGGWLLIPGINKGKNEYKWLLFAELVLITVISVIGFILPEFIPELEQNTFTPNVWIGLILILHALVHLLIERFSDAKLTWWLFLVYLFTIAMGGLLIDSRSIDIPILITIFVVTLFVILTIYLLLKATRTPKVLKEVKPKAENTTNEGSED